MRLISIALVIVAMLAFTTMAVAKDEIHINTGHADKWEGAAIGIGAVAVLHWHNWAIPKAAGHGIAGLVHKAQHQMSPNSHTHDAPPAKAATPSSTATAAKPAAPARK